MKKISILFIIPLVLLNSCKEPKLDYKHQDKEDLFACSAIDMDLIHEAVYAFEDYAAKHYSFNPPYIAAKGYFYYWIISKTGRLPAVEFIGPDIIEIRDVLKEEKDLWVTKDGTTTLNYNHPIITCISKNMVGPDRKKLFDVLVDSNTFKTEVFLASMKRTEVNFIEDRAFATFLVLDTFYARILDFDFDNVEESLNLNRENYNKKYNTEKDEIKEGLKEIQ